ncbi:MAG TPA: thiamine pyrophosphate-binding protein, partial [Actinomycetota bacterium]|nr:thiamine pyrophosphate-binding protein [Actinomycetota bacterium]
MPTDTVRLTVAQAIVTYLSRQYSVADGRRRRLVPAALGIFGHGNVAGLGQALDQLHDRMPFIQGRNEQALVHAATAYAKATRRRATLAVTASIGPGALNMVTGAGLATVNRLPVLLLPGDLFASRVAPPVRQQQESAGGPDVSANDAFKPVSRYWDRINRPDQLPGSLLEAMRVLTDPAETGAVTLALPQDVQTEAFDYPEELFERRVWHVARPVPEPAALARAVEVLRGARRPLLVAGGGVIYSEATGALRALVEATGVPVAETYAGKGSMPYDHPSALGAIGVTGTDGANAMAREADVVVGVGTRWADFATASHSIFTNPEVRFVNVNVAPVDAFKHAATPVVADAREALEALAEALAGWRVDDAWRQTAAGHNRAWDAKVERV